MKALEMNFIYRKKLQQLDRFVAVVKTSDYFKGYKIFQTPKSSFLNDPDNYVVCTWSDYGSDCDLEGITTLALCQSEEIALTVFNSLK